MTNFFFAWDRRVLDLLYKDTYETHERRERIHILAFESSAASLVPIILFGGIHTQIQPNPSTGRRGKEHNTQHWFFIALGLEWEKDRFEEAGRRGDCVAALRGCAVYFASCGSGT